MAAARGAHGDLPGWALLLEGLVSITAGEPPFVDDPAAQADRGNDLEDPGQDGPPSDHVHQHQRRQLGQRVSGVLSVVFGVLIAIAPGAGELALVLWIGAYTVVFGVLPIAFAFRLRRARAEGKIALARAA